MTETPTIAGTVCILTTNGGIAERGEIFEDSTIAAVGILARLLHHAVLQVDGESYRMRAHIASLRAGLNHSSSVGNSRDRIWGEHQH
jgi:hypothetical protein